MAVKLPLLVLIRVLATALSAGLIAATCIIASTTQSAAQMGFPGGEGPRSGGDQPGPRPHGPGGEDRARGGGGGGGGVLRGIETFGPLLEELQRQQQPPSESPPDKKTKRDGNTPKNPPPETPKKTPVVGAPPPPPPPPPTIMFFNPLLMPCDDCNELLRLIYKRQAQVAEDEAKLRADEVTLVSLQDKLARAQANKAATLRPKDKAHYQDEINEATNAIKNTQTNIGNLKNNIADERKSLIQLIADFRDCVERHCPGKLAKQHLAIINVTNDGVLRGHEDIDCGGHKGSIDVRTGVNLHWLSLSQKDENGNPVPQDRINEISISYKGTNCDDCAWVQFNWTEVQVTKNGKMYRKEGQDSSTAGTKKYTTDPANPNYIVDNKSQTNASYEAPAYKPDGTPLGGTFNADEKSDTIFDRPTGGAFERTNDAPFTPAPYENEQDDHEVTKLVQIDHFEAFLICSSQVCAKVAWSSTWTATRKADGKFAFGEPSYDVGTTTSGRPNQAEYQALIDKFSPK